MQRIIRLTLKFTRSQKTGKRFLAPGQNLTLETWICEDFTIAEKGESLHTIHSPPCGANFGWVWLVWQTRTLGFFKGHYMSSLLASGEHHGSSLSDLSAGLGTTALSNP